MPIRETGSVVVRAQREAVFEAIRQQLAHGGPVDVSGSRIRWERDGTETVYVLEAVPEGTRVIHAQATPRGLRGFLATQEGLREAIEADLHRIQRLVDKPTP